MKHGRIRQQLEVAFGNQPLSFCRHRTKAVETPFLSFQLSQRTVSAIAYGSQCIFRKIKRNRLITLHSERIRNPVIDITHITPHQGSLSVQILIILENGPAKFITTLHILNKSQTFTHHLPFDGTNCVLIWISILQRIFVIKQIFGKYNIGCGQRLLLERKFYRHH